jgi:hypothetical protein
MDKSDELSSDALSQLQLRIARRADELARDSNVSTPMNLHCWLMAESELIGRRRPGGRSASRKLTVRSDRVSHRYT